MNAITAGYKQTEAGAIPWSWTVAELQRVCRETITYGIVQCGPHIEDGVPYIRVSDMDAPILDAAGMLRTSQTIASKFTRSTVQEGDVVYALRGKLGEVRLVSRAVAGANLTQGTARLSPNQMITSAFLLWVMRSLQSLRQAELGAKGTTFREITLADLRKISIPVPSLLEQQAIAAALSDVDALLAKLDQFIAKKRDVKQAAMQQLLTGQTRLPGFNEKWSSIKIATHASLKARVGWQALTTAEYLNDGRYYLVTGTDFVNGRVNWSSCHFVDQWRYEQDRNIQLRDGDVLLTKDGTIGKVGYVDDLHGQATLNSGVFVIRPLQSAFIPLFLFYILTSRTFNDFLALITAGSTIIHLYQKDFLNFEFAAPRLEEQTAIATVLSDMDAEIAALEARRDKTRALKQGMMQELLTGRIRLV